MSITRRHVIVGASVTGLANVAVAAAAAAYAPRPSIVSLLGTLTDDIARASPVQAHFLHAPAFLGTLPNDQGGRCLVFDTALELDTDGWPGDQGNPDWQVETSLRYQEGSSLNANRVPYIVLPLPRAWPAEFGITLGDYAAVLFQGRLAFAVFGDQGPHNKLGEGSVELLRRQGQERVEPNGHVKNAGTKPGVLTIVFPHSGSADDRIDETTLLYTISTKGRALFVAAGGPPPE